MPSDTAVATTNTFEGIRTLEVNGASLAYREEGDGEPVVLVHGSASDLRSWEQQLPALATSYRTIAYSRRYARPNRDIAPGADDQMLPHVEDLAALLTALDAAPAHLVGHSWGGFIALVTAIRHPGLVRSLVLAEPPVLPLYISVPPRAGELIPLFATRPRTALTILAFGARTFAPARRAFRRGDDGRALDTFARGTLGARTYQRVPEARKQQARDNLNTVRAQLLGAGFPPLSDDDVRGVAAPTLLISGMDSPAYALRLVDRLQELLPNAERIEIVHASHVMTEENPSAVNDALLDFFRRAVAGR